MFGKMQIVPVAAALVLAATLVLGGCAASDRATGPQQTAQGPSCGAGGVVRLAQLQGAVLDCSHGVAISLPGNGASYLVVPNLAVGEVSNTATSYVIGGTGLSATADVSPLAGSAAAAASVAGVLDRWAALQQGGPGARQHLFDARLRRLTARRLAAAGARTPGLAGARASVTAAPPPPVGTLRPFHVISSLDTIRLSFQRVTARLEYVGTNIMVYVDTAAPPGFSASDIANFAATFDQVLYPIDLAAFGPPSDIDQNGHLIMLLSPVVNALTTSGECQSQGYVAGFFSGGDLVFADTTSNQGEVFYALAPDPAGRFSCAHPLQELEDQLGATFLHEVQHLINFSQHVLARNSDQEEGWLDEGLSLVAEELGARYYEDKYPPPSGRTNPAQIFPDSAQGYVGGLLVSSYDYLLHPDTTTLTLHSDADGGFEWRGGDWLLLRWLGDQKGGATFFKSLVQSPRTGIANIEAAAGESFASLFGDFSTAVYTDSLPGLPKSQVPARDRFQTRTLRRLYAAVYRVAAGDPSVPFVFPIQPRRLPASGTIAGSLVPGTMAFYRATASPSASTITITFATPSGTPLPAQLQPQVSVFRLPPGQ